MVRTIILWGLYWDTPILRNYYIGLRVQGLGSSSGLRVRAQGVGSRDGV